MLIVVMYRGCQAKLSFQCRAIILLLRFIATKCQSTEETVYEKNKLSEKGMCQAVYWNGGLTSLCTACFIGYRSDVSIGAKMSCRSNHEPFRVTKSFWQCPVMKVMSGFRYVKTYGKRFSLTDTKWLRLACYSRQAQPPEPREAGSRLCRARCCPLRLVTGMGGWVDLGEIYIKSLFSSKVTQKISCIEWAAPHNVGTVNHWSSVAFIPTEQFSL